MRCEDGKQQLSLLVDGELGSAGQAGLFRHLEDCGECRAFLETLMRARNAAKRDRETILREADEVLPSRPPLPAARESRRATASWLFARDRAGIAVPAALALAALLLVAGVVIGAGLTRGLGRQPAPRTPTNVAAPDTGAPTIVYVCSAPEYEVVGRPAPTSGD